MACGGPWRWDGWCREGRENSRERGQGGLNLSLHQQLSDLFRRSETSRETVGQTREEGSSYSVAAFRLDIQEKVYREREKGYCSPHLPYAVEMRLRGWRGMEGGCSCQALQ